MKHTLQEGLIKRTFLLPILLVVAIFPARAQQRGAEAEIRDVLNTQAAAWNRGDLQGFMEPYWKSPNTVFVRSRGVIRGWQEVFDAYRRTYPDHTAMGKASFTQMEVTVLSPDAALVLAHWHLERAEGQLGGVFTLVLRKFPEGWRIILDHTSAMDPPPED